MSWDEHIMLIAHTVNVFGDKIKVIGNTGALRRVGCLGLYREAMSRSLFVLGALFIATRSDWDKDSQNFHQWLCEQVQEGLTMLTKVAGCRIPCCGQAGTTTRVRSRSMGFGLLNSCAIAVITLVCNYATSACSRQQHTLK